jgi:regulator of sigma E protease
MPIAMKVATGILVMLACFGLQVLIHETGHWSMARLFSFRTPAFSVGFGKRKWSLILGRFCHTEFRLAPIPMGGFVSIPEMQDPATAKKMLMDEGIEEEPRFFPVWKRIVVALAGVTFNLISVPIMIFLLLAIAGIPINKIESTSVRSLATDVTIARDAGFKPDDTFVSVNGKSVVSPQDLQQALSNSKGQPATVVVRRGNENVAIEVTPDKDGYIGTALNANARQLYVHVPLTMAASTAFHITDFLFTDTVKGVGMMLRIVPRPPEIPASALEIRSMVGIVQMGASAFNQGVFAFVWFQALLAFNLIILNVLPLPLLDGGHVAFLLWEKVSGKPVGKKLQGTLYKISFALLGSVVLMGLFNDIKHIILGS